MKVLQLLLLGTVLACGHGCSDGSGEGTPVESSASGSTVSDKAASAATETLADLDVAAGLYNLDKGHASLVWTVSHNGLSKYTARFTDFDATIDLDTNEPAASKLSARINPLSVRTDHPSDADWDTTMATDNKWFNGQAFPEITYTSTSIQNLQETSGIIEGELTLLGITHPVTLNVTFNGVRNFPWFGERDVIGFSAAANLNRSDFGMTALLPDIGDDVSIKLEVEFIQSE